MTKPFDIQLHSDHISGHFSAMASPCEVLIDCLDEKLAMQLTQLAHQEASRIEHKYSRYRTDNLIYQINNGDGRAIDIDAETFKLLEFANTCYQLSDGMFDITSGILRKAWKFDGSANVPTPEQVEALTDSLGWEKVEFNQQHITMPAGFEVDFGGIGKEYAVDCVAKSCLQHAPEISVLVNFGGDIQVTRPRHKQPFWQVGIEDPSQKTGQMVVVNIANGGLATSGDAKRFLLKDGKRYSHILNPKTGFPVEQAPRSVTVATDHCIQSGLLATMALLQGSQAENFLQQQKVTHWCFR